MTTKAWRKLLQFTYLQTNFSPITSHLSHKYTLYVYINPFTSFNLLPLTIHVLLHLVRICCLYFQFIESISAFNILIWLTSAIDQKNFILYLTGYFLWGALKSTNRSIVSNYSLPPFFISYNFNMFICAKINRISRIIYNTFLKLLKYMYIALWMYVDVNNEF